VITRLERHAGAQFGRGLVECDAALEVAVPGGAAGATDVLHVPGKLCREGHHGHGDLLAGVSGASQLANLGADLQVIKIGIWATAIRVDVYRQAGRGATSCHSRPIIEVLFCWM